MNGDGTEALVSTDNNARCFGVAGLGVRCTVLMMMRRSMMLLVW